MEEKLLENTNKIQTKKRIHIDTKEDIYKIDFNQINETKETIQNPPKKRGRKKKSEKILELDNYNGIELNSNIDFIEDKNDESKNAKKKKKTKEVLKKKQKSKSKKVKKTETGKSIKDGIKINAQDGMTEIFLENNKYRIEIYKLEYNIYTEESGTSYIIVRDEELKIICGDAYLFLKKQDQDYKIITNQDFKINYVIDDLERKNNVVNFKLTNLTEVIANEDGIIFVIDEEKVIENNLEDNKTLIISEEDGKVYLPYTKEDIKNEILQNKGAKISEVIEEKYILPLDKYKSSMRARFKEGYNLMYKKEGKSKKSAILLGIELMFETNLHPAIISACKNLEELDIYLDCLEDNELEKFSCFKIIYKSLPMLRKKNNCQEF